MAWWSGAWERLRASTSRIEDPSRGAAAVTDATASPATIVQRRVDWPTAAPMPRVIDPHPLIAPLDPFTAALPTRRSPSFLGPLEHVVTPDGGGIVSGLATIAADAGSGPVSASTPPPAATMPAAVQRQAVEPDLVLPVSNRAPVAPTRKRAVPVIAGAAGDSLLRAADPAPPRELPVVARLVDASADAAPGTRPAPPTSRAPEPLPSPASSRPSDHSSAVPQPESAVVARSVADPSAGLDQAPVVTLPSGPALRTGTAPRAVSSSGHSSDHALSTDRTKIGPPAFAPLASALTVAQRTVHAPDQPAPPPFSPPAPVPAVDVQRAGDAGSLTPLTMPPSSRPTFGLGAPLTDVEHEPPAEPPPVAVGFAAFPFGDAPAAGNADESESASPATVVARSLADPPRVGSMSTANPAGAGGRSWTGSPTAHQIPLTPLPAVFTDPVTTLQRAVATAPAAVAPTSTDTSAPLPVTGISVAGVGAATSGPPATGPAMGSGAGPSVSSSAGEAAVRAGVAQRAVDGSYVFAAPVPSSPMETASSATTLDTAPRAPAEGVSSPAAAALPLRTTATGSERAATAAPVAQRLWGSEALNPGALVERARDGVPTLPTAAVPSMLPHVPALPSPPALPSLPAMPPVTGLPSLPAMPSLPAAPSLPAMPRDSGLPSVPSLPGLPGLPGPPGLPERPALGSLPGVPALPLLPTVPTLSVPTLPTAPTLPGAPSLPGIPSLQAAPGSGLPGTPAAPAAPALPAVPVPLSFAPGSGLPFGSGVPTGGPAATGPASLPGGQGGGVDHPLSAAPPDRVITSTAPTAAPTPEPSPPPAIPPAATPAFSSAAAGAAPAAMTGAAGGASAAAAAPGLDIDDLARRLIDPISARLRTELWLDRERAGLLTDL